MLKFKKNGKIVGTLKDDASEPEGEFFKFKDAEENHIEMTTQQEGVVEELEDETVC